MIDFKEKIARVLAEHVEGFTAAQLKEMLEVPADSSMGDYAFPCFRLAKTFRKAPPMIAQEIASKLGDALIFEKAENVNGYVNFFLKRAVFTEEVLKEVIEKGKGYGRSDVGEKKKVIVEFSSPNIAKPFHIGHIRSTVIGNAIYKLYDFIGYDTVRINHLGDYGTQFGKMIVSYRRWGNEADVKAEPIKTLLSYYVKFHEEAEKDPSLEDEAREVFTKLENHQPEEVRLWQWFREESLKEFSRVYGMLGIEFDSYAGESFYSDKMGRVIDLLNEKKLLKESEGAQIVELEDYNLAPALVMKKDGSTLYITRDIAAAIYRKETYDFYKNIYVVASQQNLHFQQWIKIIELMGFDWAKDCVHVPFGLVSLEEGTMSTRQGRVVHLEEVLNRAVKQTREIIIEKNVNTDNIDETSKQIGIGAVIFQELSNNRIKDYVFSWDKVLNFEGETGPYVQYTYARASSILRKAEMEVTTAVDYHVLSTDTAYELSKLIYKFPDIILEAADRYEPSILTRHVVDIAQAFNKFYNDEHILVADLEVRKAKILLVSAARNTIKNGLTLLGMEAPEKM
ncbi:MAG: arginine--tRNA ligase [Anaerovorax sp.]